MSPQFSTVSSERNADGEQRCWHECTVTLLCRFKTYFYMRHAKKHEHTTGDSLHHLLQKELDLLHVAYNISELQLICKGLPIILVFSHFPSFPCNFSYHSPENYQVFLLLFFFLHLCFWQLRSQYSPILKKKKKKKGLEKKRVTGDENWELLKRRRVMDW